MGNVCLKQKNVSSSQRGGGKPHYNIKIKCINSGGFGCISDITQVLSELLRWPVMFKFIQIHNISGINRTDELQKKGVAEVTSTIIPKWINNTSMGFKIMKAPSESTFSTDFLNNILYEIRGIQKIPDRVLKYTTIKKKSEYAYRLSLDDGCPFEMFLDGVKISMIFLIYQQMCNNEMFGKFDKSTTKSITPKEVYNLGYYFFSIFHKNCSYNDVKPENFVICGEKLKFIDFGFVQKVEEVPTSYGTEGFVSPVKHIFFTTMNNEYIVDDITKQLLSRIAKVFRLNNIDIERYQQCIFKCIYMIRSYVLESTVFARKIITTRDWENTINKEQIHRKNDEFALFVTIFIFSINYLIKKHVTEMNISKCLNDNTIINELHNTMKIYKSLINNPKTIYEKNQEESKSKAIMKHKLEQTIRTKYRNTNRVDPRTIYNS